MAMMDNSTFLISHIRNSFITSDNTGMSEHIIERDELFEQQTWMLDRCMSMSYSSRPPLTPSKSEDDTDVELAHSYDIGLDMDGLRHAGGHRRRSNTEFRLEKLKREKHLQSKIRHVQWKDVQHPVDEVSDHFERQPIVEQQPTKTSALSKQLESSVDFSNCFMEYAKYDGRTNSGLPTKKIQIFLTMLDSDEARWPMSVSVLCSARVYDLIGLICWIYTMECRKPDLPENISQMSLHIAEDDGEVDSDFPALDHKEPISKFGFSKLALVQTEASQTEAKKPTFLVTINMPDRGTSTSSVNHDTMPMREFLDALLKRRNLQQVKGLEYKLEKQQEPGVAVDLDKPLSAMDTYDFCLVRENSVRGDIEEQEVATGMCAMAESLTSHQYKSYLVELTHRMRPNTDVQLGICGEKIEITPVFSKGKFFRQKPLTYDTDIIAACQLVESKSSGRSTSRLVYQHGADFRNHEFECDTTMAKEIVQKIRNILEMRSSHVIADYVAYREKKLQKRHTISIMPS